jgi:hypothetical protein
VRIIRSPFCTVLAVVVLAFALTLSAPRRASALSCVAGQSGKVICRMDGYPRPAIKARRTTAPTPARKTARKPVRKLCVTPYTQIRVRCR